MPLPAIPVACKREKMVYDVMEWIQALGDELLPTDPEWIIGKLRILLRTGGLAEQQRIIEYARAGDLLSHEALMREFHEILNEDGKPSTALRAYAAERHRHPQRGKGADWSVNLRRDFWIALLVEWTCEAFGITATQNSEPRPDRSRKDCGTDVVAEALRRSGYPLSERAVADLCGRCPVWDRRWDKLGLPMREHTKIIVAELLQRRQNPR